MIIADRAGRYFRSGDIWALSNISFCIQAGETVGVIGKNGAGKTTLLKLAAGVLMPTTGTVWTFQNEAWKDLERNRGKIGLLSAMQNQLVPSNTLQKACQYHKMLYQIDDKSYKEMFELVGKSLGVHRFMEVPFGRLSVGERRRGEFLISVLHRPKLLFLDEPTIGMDEQNRCIFNETIHYLNEEFAMTIVTASHDLQSLQETSRRVLLLQNGELAFDGRWELLRKRADPWRCITFYTPEPIDLEDIPIQYMEYENGQMRLMFRETAVSIEGLHRFLTGKARIKDFQIQEVDIETIVCKILQSGGRL